MNLLLWNYWNAGCATLFGLFARLGRDIKILYEKTSKMFCSKIGQGKEGKDEKKRLNNKGIPFKIELFL